jgi:hypothetical protein
MPTNWTIDTSHMVNRHQAKTLLRRYPDEVAACLGNLGLVIDALKVGQPLASISPPFFRSEGNGVFRIGQTGVPSAREMRLYVTFVFVAGIAYVIAVGTKNTQARDIADARRVARLLKKETP